MSLGCRTKGGPPKGKDGETVPRLWGKVNGKSKALLMRAISVRVCRDGWEGESGTEGKEERRECSSEGEERAGM
jgi:hypothetical protein